VKIKAIEDKIMLAITNFLFPCYIAFTVSLYFNLRRDCGNSRHVIVIFIKHICKGLITLIGLFRVKLS